MGANIEDLGESEGFMRGNVEIGLKNRWRFGGGLSFAVVKEKSSNEII
jgi:hypothetical protein